MKGQRTLKGSAILCIGGGGLGSPALMYLAAAGMGTIGIVDDDAVDESNLQRQIIHSTQSVGTPKVESAEARIAGINPHVRLVKHALRLTSANALAILKDYDLVLDGSDNFPTRYLVNDACVILGKPLIYGAVQKFEGQVSVFNYRGGPNYRDLFPEPPPPGEVPSCAEGGVLGVLPGVIGCMQATEAIKVALGVESGTLSGRLLIYDAMRMVSAIRHGHHRRACRAVLAALAALAVLNLNSVLALAHLPHACPLSQRFHEVRLKPAPNAPRITELIDYDGFCSGASVCAAKAGGSAVAAAVAAPAAAPQAEPFECISVAETSRRMQHDGWAPFVLDVRSKAEAEIVALPFADLLQPHRQVSHVAATLPRDRDILVHCKGGVRSKAACHTLAGLGFTKLFSMDGGIIQWAKSIDPSMPIY